MSATLIPDGKFYAPKHERHNSTRVAAAISRDVENSSTSKLRSDYYTEIIEEQMKMSNVNKVKSFLNLEQNWNDKDALPFTPDLVFKTIQLLLAMDKQPEIFPTSRESIQFEYEKNNGDYLEFEIFQDGIHMFFMNDYDTELEKELAINNTKKINKIVSDFYEGRIS